MPRVVRSEHPDVGSRLRAGRTARGLSLRDLASRLGVSPSLISQVETGRTSPSVSTLYAIANELDVSLDELLFDRPSANRGTTRPGRSGSSLGALTEPIQRGDSRKRIRLASGVVWERLTTDSDPNTDFLYVTYEVGGASSPEHDFQRHSGHEWGYVLTGRLGVTVAFDDRILEPGDSISFESTVPHRMYNAGDTPAHGIWFVMGRRRFADAASQDAAAHEAGLAFPDRRSAGDEGH